MLKAKNINGALPGLPMGARGHWSPCFRLSVRPGGVHGSESRLTNHGDSDGNRFLQLRPSPEGLACRVFRGSILVVRRLALLPIPQESPCEGRGVNLTSVPWGGVRVI